MQSSKIAVSVIVLLAIACFYLLYRVNLLESQVVALSNVKVAEEHEEEAHEDFHLGEKMSKLFSFHQKLGSAIKANNKELAEFYLEEIDETAEDLVAEDIYEDSVHISQLIRTILLPEIERLENTLENADSVGWLDGYVSLLNTCNKCHTLAKHEFIHVKPIESILEGQDFAVRK